MKHQIVVGKNKFTLKCFQSRNLSKGSFGCRCTWQTGIKHIYEVGLGCSGPMRATCLSVCLSVWPLVICDMQCPPRCSTYV